MSDGTTWHWLLYPNDPLPGNLPIGCTRGVTSARAAVEQALPRKEWDTHHASPAPALCPVCAEFNARRDP